jgi:hypothetical protein
MLRFASVALVIVLGFLALRCGSTQDLNAFVSIPAPSDNPEKLSPTTSPKAKASMGS